MFLAVHKKERLGGSGNGEGVAGVEGQITSLSLSALFLSAEALADLFFALVFPRLMTTDGKVGDRE